MTDILRIQREAQDRGFDSAVFYISAPKGVFEAKWLDAYFGLFEIPAVGEGFITVQQLPPDWEAFWDKGEAEDHNEAFAPIRDFLASAQKRNESEDKADD